MDQARGIQQEIGSYCRRVLHFSGGSPSRAPSTLPSFPRPARRPSPTIVFAHATYTVNASAKAKSTTSRSYSTKTTHLAMSRSGDRAASLPKASHVCTGPRRCCLRCFTLVKHRRRVHPRSTQNSKTSGVSCSVDPTGQLSQSP